MPVFQKASAGFLVVILLMAAGCVTHHREPPAPATAPAPAVDQVAVDSLAPEPGFYVVKKGDTLSAIAKNFGIALRSLADWNGISPPYNVRAGQVLQLFQQKQAVRPGAGNRDIVKIPKKRRGFSQKKSINSIDSTNNLKLYWHWPLKGSILKSYSAEGSKGIDIAGEVGQTVRAAEAGKVVYSGDGLVGYGNLLIIRHSDVYLSAYANNSKLLVTEGDQVDKDQAIAEVGSVGSQACLHFEIRKNGSPVDPVKYLPEK